jgi:tetratricopeptide (TPR) repeat protein
MKNEYNFIIEDLKILLKKYLIENEIDEFIRTLNNLDDDGLIAGVPVIDKVQVDFEISSSKEQRYLIDNIITVSENLLTEEKFCRILLDLTQIMINNGELNLALEITQEVTALTESNPDYLEFHADNELLISKIYWTQAQWEDCEFHLEQAYSIFKKVSNRSGYVKCENMYGTVSGEKGEILKAKNHFEKALMFLEDDEDISAQAMILTNLGIIYTILGNFEKAMWNLKNAVEKYENLNDLGHIARVHHNIGMLYTRMAKYDEALEEFNKCITVSLGTNNLPNCAIAYIGKAYIYQVLDNQQLSDAFVDKAMEIAYKINDTLTIADIYKIKGMINSNLENFELSEEFFENSIRLNKDFDNKYNLAEGSAEMGKLLEKLDRKDDAKIFTQNAFDYFKELFHDRPISGMVEMAI